MAWSTNAWAITTPSLPLIATNDKLLTVNEVSAITKFPVATHLILF